MTPMHRCARPARSPGYSMLELMIALAIVALMVSMAQSLFIRMQQQQRARDGMRHLVSIANEARNTALILGAANATTRVTYVSGGVNQCPAEFSASNLAPVRGRAALVIDTNAAPTNPLSNSVGNSVTYISQIQRNGTGSPANFIIGCTTVNFTQLYRNDLLFITTGMNLPNASGRYTVAYDARGFVANTVVVNNAVPAIAMQENQSGGRRFTQRVLILGSGYPCLEGAANQCSSN